MTYSSSRYDMWLASCGAESSEKRKEKKKIKKDLSIDAYGSSKNTAQDYKTSALYNLSSSKQSNHITMSQYFPLAFMDDYIVFDFGQADIT